jgi:hypothetical protein
MSFRRDLSGLRPRRERRWQIIAGVGPSETDQTWFPRGFKNKYGHGVEYQVGARDAHLACAAERNRKEGWTPPTASPGRTFQFPPPSCPAARPARPAGSADQQLAPPAAATSAEFGLLQQLLQCAGTPVSRDPLAQAGSRACKWVGAGAQRRHFSQQATAQAWFG